MRLTPWGALLARGTEGEIEVGGEMGIRVLYWRVGQTGPSETLETALQGTLLVRGTEGGAWASHSLPAPTSREAAHAPRTPWEKWSLWKNMREPPYVLPVPCAAHYSLFVEH